MPIIGSVRGGMDGNVVQEETGETRPIAAAALHGRPDEYFFLRVRGDSMYPEIWDGDCVLVKKRTVWKAAQWQSFCTTAITPPSSG